MRIQQKIDFNSCVNITHGIKCHNSKFAKNKYLNIKPD